MTDAVGIVSFIWQGQKYDAIKGSSLRLPDMQNVTQIAGATGYPSKQFQIGEAKATPLLLEGMSLAAFTPRDRGELQIVADTGQKWVIPAAYILSAPTMTDDGGKMPITWNFATYEEILN
ncbi:phage tail tube protein [Komagataeibacter xylinus]|uniref:phage tail tube protein n=1 Tax=Komagataeibacter xylinus TaxID=28448 RepID=UPI00280AAA15|nr:phage tail tube protein [Komagataeibacter xylinus]